MAEPHMHVPEEPDPGGAPPSASAAADDIVIFDPNAEPSDDTPTIISKNLPSGVRNDETLAGSLRGRRLAHFELIEPIGVGGMAAVLRARDLQLDRYVALKILPPDMAADPENVQRFHQEARAAARLDHENIARVFFCGEDQGLHFIAFEFVEGENLRTFLERRGRLPVPEAIHYMLQVATGLAHAAARGVVHRDIKPSNIIITPNGRAKLVDMGLARSLHSDNGLTQPGVTLGTFDYISPEQALEPREADVRSDIYSLGCTFYHMLTGQAPVPDGTPAKKLHHHQHVPPVDPRQLNPEVPDDLAAILARMMTKDPNDRYQRPEHLVQHLLALAQKFGTGAEIPDGAMFVDVPLPNPPRSRPLPVVLAAASVLLGLVVLGDPHFWSPAGPRRTTATTPNPVLPPGAIRPADHTGDRTDTPTEVATSRPRPVPTPRALETPTPAEYQVADARELAAVLAQKPEVVTIKLTREINLNDLIDAGMDGEPTHVPRLVFEGRELTLEAANGGPPVPVRLKYNPDAGRGSPWAALTIRSGKVRLRHLRFELDAAWAADITMSAVAVQGGRVTVEDCELVQLNLPEADAGQLTSVAVSGGQDLDRPEVVLSQCYFAGGHNAVSLTGAGALRASSSSFAPHTGPLFRLERAGRTQEVVLDGCSAFLTTGPAFSLDEGSAARLDVRHCIFSHPENGTEGMAEVALVRQTSDRLAGFSFDGTRNYYHNLPALWARQGAPDAAALKLAAFRKLFGVKDDGSTESTQSPWSSSQPLAALREGKAQQGFAINTQLPELRQSDVRRALGVERCTWGIPYEGPLPPPEIRRPLEQPVVRGKVVDPKAVEAGNGVYPTLEEALASARSGDVIHLRHQGLLRVNAQRLERPVEVTIRPEPGYRPVLTLGQTTDADAALFRVHDGLLRLEQLEFFLQPSRNEYKAQTVVALMGDGQCVFKDCVATLEETREVPLALVTLGDPSSVMRMDPQPMRQQEPRLRVGGCFVRGAGDLVSVRASRPFEVEVEDSLLVLRGSLLVLEGNPREQPSRPHVTLTLKQLTSYLEDHLIWLRGARDDTRPGRGLGTTQVSAEDCLFFAAAGKSLVHVDGVDTDEQMKRAFGWAGRHNAYSNFPQMLDQQPTTDGSMGLPPYDRTRWVAFTNEVEGRFDRARFAAPPGTDTPLSRVAPADFRLRPEGDFQGYGATIDRLPRPHGRDGDTTAEAPDA